MPSETNNTNNINIVINNNNDNSHKSHCEYFKFYYLVIVGCFIISFFVLIVAPKELREGNRGCSGGCGSETSDCCIYSDSSICSGRCFCSVRDSSDDWYCRDKAATLSGAALAFFSIFFVVAILSTCACANKMKERKNQSMVSNPTSETIVTCSATKATMTSPMGFALQRDDTEHELYVSNIDDNSPFQGTLMRVGMAVNKINETWVGGKQVTEAMQIIQNAPAGKMTITGKVSPATHLRAQRFIAESSPTTTTGFAASVPAITAGSGSGSGSATATATATATTTAASNPGVSNSSVSTSKKAINNDKKEKRSIVAVCNKTSPDQKLGLVLGHSNHGLFHVKDIKSDSPFMETDLREGMQVTSINGHDLEGKDMTFAMAILRGAAGSIIVVAETEYDPAEPKKELIVSKVNKDYQGQKLGITLGTEGATGMYHVAKLSPSSPFTSTQLEEGMTVLKINDMKLKGEPMSVAMMLLKESMSITIVAEGLPSEIVPSSKVQAHGPSTTATTSTTTTAPPAADPYVSSSAVPSFANITPYVEQPKNINNSDETSSSAAPPMPRIVATVTKDTVDQKLGITMARNQKGHFIISMLSPSSPFSIMGLEVGMRVTSINDIDITGQPMSVAMMLLKESVGDVTLAAEKVPRGGPPPPSSDSAFPPTTTTNTTYNEPEYAQDDPPMYGGAAHPIAEARLVEPEQITNYGVVTPSFSAAGTIRVVATKRTSEEKLGVAMKRDSGQEGGMFTISLIAPNSPFRNTALKVGMRVMNINGIAITGQEMDFVTTILKSSVGQIEFEVMEQEEEEWM